MFAPFAPQGKWLVKSQSVLRDKIYQDVRVRDALIALMKNIEWRVSKQLISHTEARAELHDALQHIARHIHTSINQQYTAKKWDQTDLSRPENMANALNNPGSLANQNMADLALQAVAVADDIASAATEQLQILAQQMPLQSYDDNDSEADQLKTQGSVMQDVEKGMALVAALKMLDEADPRLAEKAVTDVFEKITGIKETDVSSDEKEAHALLSKIPVPKLTPPRE